MKSYRKSILCQMCNFESQKFIDEESFTVLFDDKFCSTFLKYTFDVIKDKY